MKGLFLIIFLIYIANVEAKESVNISPFPYYEVVAKTNYDLGYKLGKLTAKLIKERHKMSDQMQKAYIPFYLGTEQGRRIFSHFLNNNTAVFPDYIQEIRGIAAGANIPFEHVFLENLGQEFSYYVPSDLKKYLEPPTHCSDYSINFDDDVGVCHNEDGSQFDLNRTLMAHCVIKDKGVTKSDFFSYFYAGHLPTAAIGFNNFGLGFSMNYLTPEIPEYGGYGRQFLARRLLDMKSISEAIPWVTQDHQSTGHNYQIVEVRTKKIVNIEAGPHQTQNIKYINSGESLFHGNNFLFVNIKQKKSICSTHREDRAKELPKPKNFDDVMNVLGDVQDPEYPIYQTGGADDTLWTLSTTCFDLKRNTVTIYLGNPKSKIAWTQFNFE